MLVWKKKTKLVKDCIKSWKKHLPDYKIIEWNEKNTDLAHPFVHFAYKQKKWAFVSDYIRLKVIYENGGVYLDTDMLVIKNIDELLNNIFFLGAEDVQFINCSIIGSVKHNSTLRDILKYYDKLNFDKISFYDITIPKIVTKLIRDKFCYKEGFDRMILFGDLVVYPEKYFYPFPYTQKKELNNYVNYIDEISYTVHLWSSSWIEYSEFHYFRNKEYCKGLKKMSKEVLNKKKLSLKYLKKILSSIKESLQ